LNYLQIAGGFRSALFSFIRTPNRKNPKIMQCLPSQFLCNNSPLFYGRSNKHWELRKLFEECVNIRNSVSMLLAYLLRLEL